MKFVHVLYLTLAVLLGAAGDAAYNSGQWEKGYAFAYSEQAVRASERARVMQYVGICKWSKIMADDFRCTRELP